MIYQGETADRQFDEIRILENDRTVFRGCAEHGGPVIFKSKVVDDQSLRKLQFFVNDQLADECLFRIDCPTSDKSAMNFFRSAAVEDRPKERHGRVVSVSCSEASFAV